MALADIVSKKFFDALDLQLTWKHMISCNWTVGGKIPVRDRLAPSLGSGLTSTSTIAHQHDT